jgi:hypothetical protein
VIVVSTDTGQTQRPRIAAASGRQVPTSLIDGHCVCTSTGSDTMLCGRVSLFTNVMWLQALMRTCVGATPSAVMVMVAADEGASGELHQAAARIATRISRRFTDGGAWS